MAAYSTSTSWSFPDDLPGGWVEVEDNQSQKDRGHAPEADGVRTEEEETGPEEEQPHRRPRAYPPRQCRICLEVVQPTFHDDTNTSLPTPLQSAPRVTYESEDGGRLLRPCKCRGSQKYVHEECLSAWRMQDPLQKRNYWQCPTCSYKYRLQRLRWGRWIGSTVSQVALTFIIFFMAMFVLGFVADPIINLYLDPVSTIASAGGPTGSLIFEDEPATWVEHFVKGLASLGLLGFAKFLLTLNPWHMLNMRGTGVYVGGSRGGTTGRDRLNSLSWIAILVGVATFLYAVWKGVRAWSRKTLEQAGERVMDVQGADDDEDEGDETASQR